MVWPVLEDTDDKEAPDDSPQFKWDRHPHSSPDHHYQGAGTCDAACRAGHKPHRHRVLKGMAGLAAEQARPAEGSLYAEAARNRPEDLDMTLAQLAAREREERHAP